MRQLVEYDHAPNFSHSIHNTYFVFYPIELRLKWNILKQTPSLTSKPMVTELHRKC